MEPIVERAVRAAHGYGSGSATGETRSAMDAREQLFTETQRKRIERHDMWGRISENGTIAAAVMVTAAIAAVICANSDAYAAIHHLLMEPIHIGIGAHTVAISVEMFVNDFLMAIFFLLVGILSLIHI